MREGELWCKPVREVIPFDNGQAWYFSFLSREEAAELGVERNVHGPYRTREECTRIQLALGVRGYA